jgi:uncharacterized protein (TIGR00730 family)
MMRMTVYASSSPRTPDSYLRAAHELGRLVAARGWLLVNGAGKDGCMGALNDGCLAAGGQVQGVILRRFAEQGLTHPGLDGVLIAEDMRTRKRLLAEDADAFIALPGGPGTWEELWEIAVQRQICATRAPLVAIDINGFYTGFRAMLARAEEDGLLYGPAAELIGFAASPAEAVALVAAAAGRV